MEWADAKDGGELIGHRTVTESAIHGFACWTGDYARLHLDHELARRSGARRPIAHGLLGAAWALGILARCAPHRLWLSDPEASVVGLRVRFPAMVVCGDTLALRWTPVAGPDGDRSDREERDGEGSGRSGAPADDDRAGWDTAPAAERATSFELVRQDGTVTTSGVVRVRRGEVGTGAGPAPWPREPWQPPASPAVFHAEDVHAHGPRGETPGWTTTEADVVGFARETGSLDPRAMDEGFAVRTAAGARIVPPMHLFCVAFGDLLRMLLRLPMPASGAAGHLGDSWRVLRPVRIGDTVRARHRPLSCRRSRSRPDQGIVELGLQLLNQRDEPVLEGTVALMIPGLPKPERAATIR